MTRTSLHTGRRVIALLGLATALTACNAITRLSEIGSPPPLPTIENPTRQPHYRPVSMPMPAPQPIVQNRNSLWRTGARAFFKDQRASDVGDILTVVIDLQDSAQINNTTSRTRTANEDASLSAFLGYETSLSRVLPEQIRPGNLIDADSKGSHKGEGKIARNEDIELKIAVVISQVLPNGNLVILGRQEVRVNFEVRELQIAGIIRPEDITSSNTISYEKIAEARIIYGGRGQITDVQQPRYGQQFYDIIFPF